MRDFTWAFILITSWSSAIVSSWLAVYTDSRLLFFAFFWIVASAIVAVIPYSKKEKK